MQTLFQAIKCKLVDMVIEAKIANDEEAHQDLEQALDKVKLVEATVTKRYLYADEAL